MDKWIIPNWPAPRNIHAISTTRSLGNLAELRGLLNLPYAPAWLKQTHSNHVVLIDKYGDKSAISHEYPLIQDCDASVTRLFHQACVVRTADCLPILICDKKGTQVAAIHAGWRGLAQGIIAQTLGYFKAYDPKDLLIWLGPAIGPMVFEVGEEVLSVFLKQDKGSAGAFTKLTTSHPLKYLLDIYALARHQLVQLDILTGAIYGGEHCTYSMPEQFYSYRRAKQQGIDETGRMATMIWIAPSL